MKVGTIATIVFSVAGLSALVFAFVSNASPYVTVAEAKTRPGDNLHLKGDINKDSLAIAAAAAKVTFDLTDEEGQIVTVVYSGPPPANMGDATQVVAIGGMEGKVFAAHKLLLKCPSKYESEEQPKA